ncbi:sialate O-acetylesterase [Roseateles oligotrophus]|uniref:Sialate O-acetylesterase n=1 Tax=Roseateles oligotrophus TaxID=1769250 RepID=A0ABT2YK12_9BURK|nr:sialate O-acetylesterase [Roseateles oligotrophus]MCV2370397.1 sialate O-acetylesterase [Roseateles oligotrophus]
MNESKPVSHWYVLVIAGQSNAQGFGEALPLREDMQPSPRIQQLGRYRGMRPDGVYEDRWNKIVDASHQLDDLKDMRFSNLRGNPELSRSGTVGPGVFIARRLLPFLPEDAGILLMPQAHGGAGMSYGDPGRYTPAEQCGPLDQPGASIGRSVCNYPGAADSNANGAMAWAGADAPLYLDLRDRTRFALQANSANRLLGFVWIQGESDAHAGDPHASEHGVNFAAMVDRLGSELADRESQFLGRNWTEVAWINVLATHWWDEALPAHREVIEGYRQLAAQRPSQMHLLDLRFGEDGRPTQTNRDHFHDPAAADYPTEVSPPLTDGRTCEPEMIHIHISSGAYRGEVSQRIADALRRLCLPVA